MTIYEFFILLGGVGLFLYGMTMMSSGLRAACGENLQHILESATSNRVKAVLVGLLMTILVQSSSATDVMVIGFVNSGLMNLGQAIGVIMGANIGTTITAQITAFNLSAYAPLILFIGAVVFMFIKNNLIKNIGSVILGFGMLFEGIALMKSAIAPLAKTQGFVDFVSSLSNPFALIIFGILFTALLQSSSSATVIFQAFAIQGIFGPNGYITCVYLVIGSAIGSVTPNLLASLTTNRNGKRTAILNLLFNIFRAVILVTLINIFPQILKGIQSLSPNDIGRQIANTHTIFAITAVVIMLPFSGLIVKLSQKLIPLLDSEKRRMNDKKLQYLVNIEKVAPAVAISQAHLEVTRMGKIAFENLKLACDNFFDPTPEKYERVEEMEEVVNFLNHAIIVKLEELQATHMSIENLKHVYGLTQCVTDMERISDYAENFIEYRQKMNDHNSTMSEDALQDLKTMIEATIASVEASLNIFQTSQFDQIKEAARLEDVVDTIEETIVNNHIKRLEDGVCHPLSGVIYTDMVNELERCSDHGLNIAYALYHTAKQ